MKIRCLRWVAFGAATLAGCAPERTDVALPGGEPRALAVGDVTGSGTASVLVGHALAPDATGEMEGVSLLTPTGDDDAFRSRLLQLPDFEPDRLLLADLDGDGQLDLVALRAFDEGGGSVRVLLGHGDGTFTYVGDLEDVGTPLAVAAADMDGDGKLDLVVSAAPPGAPLQVHHGLGGGAFAKPETDYDVSPSERIAVGDVNGDGKLEVVMGSYDGYVDVLGRDDAGAFLAPIRTRVGHGRVALAIADLNGNDKPEIVATATESPWVSVVTARGTCLSEVRYDLDAPARDVAVGDVDGDGKLEIVTLDAEKSAVSLLKSGKDGGYEVSVTARVGAHPVALALADLHGKGQLDAITANARGGSISVLHFFRDAPAPPPTTP